MKVCILTVIPPSSRTPDIFLRNRPPTFVIELTDEQEPTDEQITAFMRSRELSGRAFITPPLPVEPPLS
jgi:hypothetical protein